MSDTPFAVGSLYGRRGFELAIDGHLYGPAYPIRFTSGVNDAYCATNTITAPASLGSLSAFVVGVDRHKALPDIQVELRRVGPDHQVAGSGCRCGFYAYTSKEEPNIHESPLLGRIPAVIEGFGHCVIGTKGFRCSKARLVAVVRPAEVRPRAKLKQKVERRRLGWVWVAGTLLTVVNVLRGNYVSAVFTSFFTLVVGVAATLEFRRQKVKAAVLQLNGEVEEDSRAWVAEAWEKFTQNYPEVKQYNSRKAMWAAHPLTKPPEDAPSDGDPFGYQAPEVTHYLSASAPKPIITYADFKKQVQATEESIRRMEKAAKEAEAKARMLNEKQKGDEKEG